MQAMWLVHAFRIRFIKIQYRSNLLNWRLKVNSAVKQDHAAENQGQADNMEGLQGLTEKKNGQYGSKNGNKINKQTGSIGPQDLHPPVPAKIGHNRRKNGHIQDAQYHR